MLAELERAHATLSPETSTSADFPFRMICRRTTRAYNSSCIDTSTHRDRVCNPAFLHPADLAETGLQRGDLALVESEHGYLIAIVDSDPHLRRGVLSISHGYGDLGLEVDRLASVGVNINRLLLMDGSYDRFSGQPLMSNVPVRVRPYEPASGSEPSVTSRVPGPFGAPR
jgi:anaerobic selenocysteine-containing dehydrogenase